MSHTCHAYDCNKPVPPKLFMCKEHWYALKKPVRDAILREYAPGQERTKTPTARYMAVQRFAIATLAFRPYDKEAAKICIYFMTRALAWQKKAIADGAGDPLQGLEPEQKEA